MKPSRCIVTPPYTGPTPHGLTEASDIKFWSNFIRSDNAIPNPVGYDEFLFYSGDDGLGENVISIREYISQYSSRTVASWARVFFTSPSRRVEAAMTPWPRCVGSSTRISLMVNMATHMH